MLQLKHFRFQLAWSGDAISVVGDGRDSLRIDLTTARVVPSHGDDNETAATI